MRTATAILCALNYIGKHNDDLFRYWSSELCDDTGELRPDAITEDNLRHLEDEVLAIESNRIQSPASVA
jgi:hypothetical protein